MQLGSLPFQRFQLLIRCRGLVAARDIQPMLKQKPHQRPVGDAQAEHQNSFAPESL